MWPIGFSFIQPLTGLDFSNNDTSLLFMDNLYDGLTLEARLVERIL